MLYLTSCIRSSAYNYYIVKSYSSIVVFTHLDNGLFITGSWQADVTVKE